MPDFAENRDLKYLTSELSKLPTNEQQVRAYIGYLEYCSFNTRYNPAALIRFSDQEADTLGRWAAARAQDQPDVVPEVLQKLKYALDQRLQLAVQQSKEIGNADIFSLTIFICDGHAAVFARFREE